MQCSIQHLETWVRVAIRSHAFYPQCEKTCLRGFVNNNCADQPAHPHSLISAFVIHFLESIVCRLATNKISIFELVSVAEENGVGNPEDRFPHVPAHMVWTNNNFAHKNVKRFKLCFPHIFWLKSKKFNF